MDRRCVQEKQRAEAAAKKLEAKKMAEAEEAALASSAKKPSSKTAGTPKVYPASRLGLMNTLQTIQSLLHCAQ